MERTIAPSVQIEAAIEAVLLDGLDEPDRLGELGRLGARLVIQRAVEEEVAAFLGRARYERTEDGLDLGRGLVRRGLRSPLLVVTDGAPGLIRAISELWPDADRQRCAVHRLRNVLGKLPDRPGLHERVRAAYWVALDGATVPEAAEAGLRALVGELAGEYPSAAACLADDLAALTTHLAIPSGSESGCGARTSWSARSRKSAGAPRSSAAAWASRAV